MDKTILFILCSALAVPGLSSGNAVAETLTVVSSEVPASEAPQAVTAKTQVAQAAAKPAEAPPATATAAQAMLVDILLERKRDGKVESMAAGHVFAKGDVIRLKLTSHYDGYLYVMDQGTSGNFMTVYPSMQTGSDNRIHMMKQYLVPAVEDGWFQVDGPAGFDVLYFLLSPTALAAPPMASFAAPGPISSLRPRCNDEIFKARGDCTDISAGPAAVAPGQALPAPIAPLADGASRDITFTSKTNGTVGVAGESSAPMLYTFRLAHL